MSEFTVRDIEIGDEFTNDYGQTWWRVSQIEPRGSDSTWIEAVNVTNHGIMSSTLNNEEKVIVR